ncbi:MAG: hypothetical protein ACPIA7_02990 [Akkermansiaceae bacterium]
MSIHVFFLWQPSEGGGQLTATARNAKLMGVEIFPAIKAYATDVIDGRLNINAGKSTKPPMLKQRLALAIERNYPVTFREEEVNVWLSNRINMTQQGRLAPYVEIIGLWVNFKEDEIELVIERRLPWANSHVTTLFMGFERTRSGYSISRHACHIGQLKLPGGFACLLMPAYQNIADELAGELQPYYDQKIYDVRVEDGKITIDPRRIEHRL